MSTTMLSTCGGFVTRRNSQMLAKYANKPNQFCSHQLQDQQTTATQLTTETTATTTTTTVPCTRLNAHQPNSFLSCGNSSWLLIAVLVTILIASTAALPRRALGRHLILPHRHHVHLRSAGQLPMEQLPMEQVSLTFTHKIKMNVSCETISIAIQVCDLTERATKELLESFLEKKNIISLSKAEEIYGWQSVHLNYSLKNDVDNKGSANQDPQEELIKILQSLITVQQLMNQVRDSLHLEILKKNFTQNFIEKLENNKSQVEHLLGNPEYKVVYPMLPRQNHSLLEFGVVNEFIRLLKVIRIKYEFIMENPLPPTA